MMKWKTRRSELTQQRSLKFEQLEPRNLLALWSLSGEGKFGLVGNTWCEYPKIIDGSRVMIREDSDHAEEDKVSIPSGVYDFRTRWYERNFEGCLDVSATSAILGYTTDPESIGDFFSLIGATSVNKGSGSREIHGWAEANGTLSLIPSGDQQDGDKAFVAVFTESIQTLGEATITLIPYGRDGLHEIRLGEQTQFSAAAELHTSSSKASGHSSFEFDVRSSDPILSAGGTFDTVGSVPGLSYIAGNSPDDDVIRLAYTVFGTQIHVGSTTYNVDLDYSVSLYWSRSGDYEDRVAKAYSDIDGLSTRGTHTIDIPVSSLYSRIDAANVLILHVDSGGDTWRGVVSETNERDNIASLKPDLQLDVFDWGDVDGIKGEYKITGLSDLAQPALIGFYWSKDEIWSSDDVQATSVELETELSVNVPHKFQLAGRFFAPPDDTHKHLIAYLDAPAPDGAVDEATERNNFLSLDISQKVQLNTQISFNKSSPRLKDELIAVTEIENNSPVPITVEVSRGFTTTNPNLEVPPPVQTTELILGPGDRVPWRIDYVDKLFLDWEWIPQENPLKSNAVDEFIGAGLDVASVWPPGKVIDTVYTVASYLAVTIPGIDQLYNKQLPTADVQFSVLVTPLVADTEPIETRRSISAKVPEDKLAAFDDFVVASKALESAVLVVNIAAPLGGNTYSNAVKGLVSDLGLVDALWTRAVDPPDADYKTFVTANRPLISDHERTPTGDY